MEPSLRRAFNAAYTPDFYSRYMERFERRVGSPIPFRVAETPFFIPLALRDRLERDANEIVAQISDPALIATMKKAIPPHLDVPGMDALPNCVQVDFAVSRNANGELEGKVVELQAFPSLYALMVLQSQVLTECLAEMPGLDRKWSLYFSGLDQESFLERFRRAVLGGEDPENVVLIDLDPPHQKTYPDFLATKMYTGVDAVCPTTLIREGKRLFRKVNGKLVQVKRFYNRVVFDELEAKKITLPFAYTDELDVSWC
ncbi:MAG: hypothetical protein ABI193_24090, partial [Minicystis sp.]